MKVRISTSRFGETSWMLYVEEDDLEARFFFGVDYDSTFERKNRFWIYDSKQEWVLIHDSESFTVDKLE
jgi:hypothetical protein